MSSTLNTAGTSREPYPRGRVKGVSGWESTEKRKQSWGIFAKLIQLDSCQSGQDDQITTVGD